MTSPLSTLPTRRALWITWTILITMTVVSLSNGDPTSDNRLPLYSVAILLAAATVKAVQVLWMFLNLRASTTTWKATFGAFLGGIVAIVLGCAALTGHMVIG